MPPPEHNPVLSVVVPACNEEARLGGMLAAYLPYLKSLYQSRFEMIVVVNGSSDNTAALARGYMPEYPRLQVLVEPCRIGKGGALMMGLAQARGEVVGFVDADGSTPPEAFHALKDHIDRADIVIASRWLPAARVYPRQPWLRRLVSRIFNILVRMLFGLRLTDTQCGAKLMRRAALTDVLPRLGTTRWAFDVDLLFQMRRAGYIIAEVPTVWNDMPGSRLSIPRASLEALLAVTRLRLLYSPLRFVVACYDRTLGRLLRRRGFSKR